jgi:hypothetical protein
MAAAAAIAGHFVDIRNWPVREPAAQPAAPLTVQEAKA